MAGAVRLKDFTECHQRECEVCPLAKEHNQHPNMPASGLANPLVYVLAEAPGRQEDEEGVQLVGESGRLFRARVPKQFKDKLRFNNVVRTRPPQNRTPTQFEIECCRPSVTADIERSKPKAIFGLGNVPLEWVSGFSGVTLWRGRKMPVKVGNHVCWYYPMLHPAFLLRQRHYTDSSEDERMFVFDLQRAFEEVEGLPDPVVHTPKDVFSRFRCLTDVDRIITALRWAANEPNIGFDYETDRLRPYADDARVLSVALDNGECGFAFPIDHPEAGWSKSDYEKLIDYWMDFLIEAECTKWVHNLSFELEWTAVRFGSRFVRAGKWEDTATQACILDERKGKSKPGCFSLEFLVQQHFGFNLKQLTNLDRSKLASEPLETVLRYNGGDARYHCLLGLRQRELIAKAGLEPAYNLALRRVPTVVLTQIKGVPVDQAEVSRLGKKYKARIEKVRGTIAELPIVKRFEQEKERKFNPASNPAVLYIMYNLLGQRECKIYDKYKRKERLSANKEVLAKIKHPLAKLLIELREATKRNSTYIEPLRKESEDTVVHDDGLVHAVFNTIFSEAGRLSAESPNLQNVPKRDEEAKEVRKQFVADEGCVVAGFDYGQIEARVIAMFTKDEAFCKALWEEYDVHMEWAERLARAYPARIGGRDKLTDKKAMKLFRTDIKNQWTFPLFFGAKLESAAEYLSIPADKLKPEYERFWRVFSGVKEWQESQLGFYRKHGYVACLTGRRRRGPLSLNQVFNSPVQGTAAEIIMDAMCRLSETGDLELQPEINIHDDLTFFRIPTKRVDEIAEKIINGMLAVPFDFVNVPITVEMSVGENWLDMEECGTFSSATWFNK